MPLFVISSEYLAKPLMNFWHTRHFCRNLPFSPKFAIFSICQFREIANCQYCWSALDVTTAILVVENKSICLLWEPNSIFMLIIREKLYCIDPQHCRLVSWLQTKNDYFVVSFKIFATPLMNPNSPISQNLSFSYNPQLWTCLFCHLILIFAKPINSYQICNFRKIAICQDATFCHVIWIFGRSLDDFLAYSPFLPKFPFFAPNLPFSYNRRLSRFSSLLL